MVFLPYLELGSLTGGFYIVCTFYVGSHHTLRTNAHMNRNVLFFVNCKLFQLLLLTLMFDNPCFKQRDLKNLIYNIQYCINGTAHYTNYKTHSFSGPCGFKELSVFQS